jgi:hypothetical protein
MSNENQTSQDLSHLKSMFADYQKKQTQGTGKKSREDLLAKYFVPRKTKETFRILPPKKGKKPIEEAYFHVVTLNGAGGKKKHSQIIYCPAHNDPKVPKLGVDGKPVLDASGAPILVPAPCPLCAKSKQELSKQDPSIKGIKKENMNEFQLIIKAKNDEIYKVANTWAAKQFHIIRGIDKGMEKDGVKFWRFKHNFKNQGTLDKLLPVLQNYIDVAQADFTSSVDGTDLIISMTDSEFNGHVYKAITAITAKGKSQLHADADVVRSWLDDDITWRDVFLPKKAPNITSYEFLQMVAQGTNPYWDDSDQNNKHWVFPGRPDLQEKANTRTMNLDNDSNNNFEQASDLEETTYQPQVTISNIKPSDVGTYQDDASDLGKEVMASATQATNAATQQSYQTTPQSSNNSESFDESDGGDEYDDLPF